MTQSLRRGRLMILMTVLLLLSVAWAWKSYDQSCRQLAVAVSETAACRELAASLARRQHEGGPTARAEMPEEQLYQRIQQAAQAAGLDDGRAIRSIRPQASRSVPNSPWRQKTVELSLEGLTMKQLVAFLYHLHAGNPQLQIAALTLHEPKGFGSAALWNVEPLVLSYEVTSITGHEPSEPLDP